MISCYFPSQKGEFRRSQNGIGPAPGLNETGAIMLEVYRQVEDW